MRTAELLATRSTCSRLQVGCVITDISLESVLSVGYNGNAKGFPNRCDSDEPGNCGCLHSEWNALIKAPRSSIPKVAFVTDSPCIICAKMMIQSGVTKVYYRREYRKRDGLDVLDQGGIAHIHYTEWQDLWRGRP